MARLSLKISLPQRGKKNSPKTPGAGAPKSDLRSKITTIRTALRRRWQVVGVIGLVFSLSLYWFALRPASERLTQVRAEARVAETRAKNMFQETKDLQTPEGTKAAQDRFDRAEALDETLPMTLGNVDMLKAVSVAATEAGLELGPSSPGAAQAPGPSEKLTYISFNITITGEYEKILSFVEKLTKDTKQLITIYSASFKYIPGSADNTIPPRVELTSELRFWMSSLPTMATIKDEINKREGKDTSQTNQTPAPQSTTPPASTDSTTPTDSTTASTAPSATSSTAPATESSTAPSTDATTEEDPTNG
jgi:Tfp pilus assembly protein PilO